MFFEYGKQHWYLRHNWPTLQRGLSAIAELLVSFSSRQSQWYVYCNSSSQFDRVYLKELTCTMSPFPDLIPLSPQTWKWNYAHAMDWEVRRPTTPLALFHMAHILRRNGHGSHHHHQLEVSKMFCWLSVPCINSFPSKLSFVNYIMSIPNHTGFSWKNGTRAMISIEDVDVF